MFLKNSPFHFFKSFLPFYVICPLVTEKNEFCIMNVCKVSSQLILVSLKREG